MKTSLAPGATRRSSFSGKPLKRRKKTSLAQYAWKEPTRQYSCVQPPTSSVLHVRLGSKNVRSAGRNFQLPLGGDFLLFVPFYSLIFLFFLWAPFFICPGTVLLRRLPWTWMTCCSNWWYWLEVIQIQSKKLKGHLVTIKFRNLFLPDDNRAVFWWWWLILQIQ